MAIHIEYKLTTRDESEFRKAHFDIGPVRRPILRWMMKIPFANQILFLLITLTVLWFINFSPARRDLGSEMIVYACAVFFTVVASIWVRYKDCQLLAKQPLVKIDFNYDGFTRTEDFARHEVRWAHIIHFTETAHLFLLYPDRATAFILPKRAFAESGDLEQFRDLVNRNLHATANTSAPLEAEPPPGADSSHQQAADGLLMQLTYKLELRDMHEFRRNHDAIRPGVKWYNRQSTSLPPWVSYLLVCGFLALMMYGTVQSYIDRGFSRAMIPGLFFLGLFLVFGVWIPLWTRRRAQKALAAQRPTHATLYSDRLIIHGPAVVQELYFYFFKKFAETKNLFVLYFTDTEALIIPRRIFAGESQALIFRDVVQAGITRTGAFPVQAAPNHADVRSLPIAVQGALQTKPAAKNG